MRDIEWKRTTYSDGSYKTYDAVFVTWDEVERILGCKHEGHPDDDAILVDLLRSAGAPAWIDGAPGWVDEDGWGLIGPEREDVDS